MSGGRTPQRSWVHERHVLVGEAGHRAGHADAAHVRAAADAVDPAADRHVALDHRALAAELHEAAVVRAVLGGEVALLREAGPVAALAHGAAEQPLRAQLLVEVGRGREPGEVERQVEQRLGHVVRLRGAARDAHDRQAGRRLPVPAEVVGHAHRARSGCSSSPGCRRRWRRSRPPRPRPPSARAGRSTRSS